jgi:hypothetical protein
MTSAPPWSTIWRVIVSSITSGSVSRARISSSTSAAINGTSCSRA